MESSEIRWRAPWRAIQFAPEIPGVQRQLEREITSAHPLHGRGAQAIGRRIDCDDVVVVLADGKYANVHLVWSKSGDPSGKWPTWFEYGRLADFVQAMNGDAEEYGDDAS